MPERLPRERRLLCTDERQGTGRGAQARAGPGGRSSTTVRFPDIWRAQPNNPASSTDDGENSLPFALT
jgi:hypothetical protein